MNIQAANLAASVHQRLLNQSKARGMDFNLLLARLAIERFLYRLALSPYADQFVLKGAMMLQVWLPEAGRPTRDLDLLGFGDLSADRLRQVFAAICDQPVEPDGVSFLSVEEDFVSVIEMIARFLGPVLDAARQQSSFPMTWLPGGPWMIDREVAR